VLTTCRPSAVLVPYGELDAASLRRAYEADPKQRLQLQLRKQARPGQKEALDHIPCYAHVRVRGELQQTAALCSVCHVMSRLHFFLFCENVAHTMEGYRRVQLDVCMFCRRRSTTLGSGMRLRLCT
jgi:hypothetical protein